MGVVYVCYRCGLRVLWVWLCNIRVYGMYIMGDGLWVLFMGVLGVIKGVMSMGVVWC